MLLTEDFLKHYRPSLNSAELERSSRIISILCGVLGYGLVFLIKLINETMQISPVRVFRNYLRIVQNIADNYANIFGIFSVFHPCSWVSAGSHFRCFQPGDVSPVDKYPGCECG